MKSTHSVYSAIALLLLSLPAAAASIDGLRFMVGCWAAVDAEAGSGEQWMPPAGKTMLGMSRTVRDGKTVTHEFLRIEEVDEGRVVLVASPYGQPAATFRLVSQSEDAVVFENPDHDFPQRISYRLMPHNLLVGRIEGVLQGAARSADFPMKKTTCGASEAA